MKKALKKGKNKAKQKTNKNAPDPALLLTPKKPENLRDFTPAQNGVIHLPVCCSTLRKKACPFLGNSTFISLHEKLQSSKSGGRCCKKKGLYRLPLLKRAYGLSTSYKAIRVLTSHKASRERYEPQSN